MELRLVTALSLILITLFGCATPPYDINKPPKDLVLNVDKATLNDLDVAIYVSSLDQDLYYHKRGTRDKVHLGEIYVEALKQYGNTLFGNVTVFDARSMAEHDQHYSLAIGLDLHWKNANGNAQIAVAYRVLDKDSITVLDNTFIHQEKISNSMLERAYGNASIRSVQYLLSSIVNSVKPNNENFPKENTINNIIPRELVDMSEPDMRLTGIKLNTGGTLLSIDVKFERCLILEGDIGETTHEIELLHQEEILDLALLKFNVKTDSYIYFDNSDNVKVGKSIAMGAYQPARNEQKIKYMFGNVYDAEGLKGGAGSFMFSTAVEPLYTGAPIIDERGALIGYKAGSYGNIKWLAKNKHLPENVYFGLKAKHIKQYLRSQGIAFNSIAPNAAEPDDLTETINNVVVPINCYL